MMSTMNYELNPGYDTDILIACTLGNVVPNEFVGLVYQAVKMTTGAPTAVAGVYIPGAIVQNAGSGVVYRNSGTTASPVFTAM